MNSNEFLSPPYEIPIRKLLSVDAGALLNYVHFKF